MDRRPGAKPVVVVQQVKKVGGRGCTANTRRTDEEEQQMARLQLEGEVVCVGERGVGEWIMDDGS